MFTTIKCKQKLLVPKCDFFDKHVEKNEGIKVMDMKCVHVKMKQHLFQ